MATSNKTWIFLLSFLLLQGASVAHAIEEPRYELLDKVGDVEIRHYQPVIQATTVMPPSGGNGFRRLAGFIFGGNSENMSIAMTAPVQENLSGEGRAMAFTLPSELSMDDLPQPDDPNVHIEAIPARIVAVLGFSGWASDKKALAKREELAVQLAQLGLSTRGDWLLNQYNPPWTLPFLRRNEIWIEVDWQQDS